MTVTTTALNNKLRELEEKLRKDYNDQLRELEEKLRKEYNDQLVNLSRQIGQLQQQVGDLKTSSNFLTEETTELKGMITKNTYSIDRENKSIDEIKAKTVDLEDRSRRQNLVLYNIPEEPIGSKERENCDPKVINELRTCTININEDPYMVLDRAHRLPPGRPKAGATKPRPIIVKFTYYRDKERVLSERKKLSGSALAMSEDYSKTTLEMHRELVQHAKKAKEALPDQITSFRITYRRVTLRYEQHSKPAFFRSFNLKDISSNQQWYLP